MSVTWTKSNVTLRETHVGLVMSSSWFREIRVMSDVYSNEYRCYVWNPAAHCREELVLGNDFDDNSEFGQPTVDISDEIKAEWAALEVKAEELRAANAKIERDRQDELDAKNAALEIKFGSEAVVTGGKKVPKGTRGKVIGVWPGNYGGYRVGIVDSAGNMFYSDKNNFTGVLPGHEVGYTPPGGWRSYLATRPVETPIPCPKKNERVRRISDGIEGVVFWAKPEQLRIGFKVPGSNDPIWANAKDVVILDVHGNPRNPPPTPAQEPRPRESAKTSPLAKLQAPYCDIRGILPPIGECRHWTAVDEKGELVMLLTEAVAVKLQALAAEEN